MIANVALAAFMTCRDSRISYLPFLPVLARREEHDLLRRLS
jgi:hypothetical protein